LNQLFLEQLYEKLLSRYGQQGWWPLLHKQKNTMVYDVQFKFQTLPPNHMDEVITGALLTQNTSWNNVVLALMNLNQMNLMTFAKIACTSEITIAELIKPSRYFRQKAQRLIQIAKEVNQTGYSTLNCMSIPTLRQWWLSLKGIGYETADSIILYAFHKPQFVIDAYTKRFFVRFTSVSDKENYHQIQERFHQALPKEGPLFNEFHALIVKHCIEICQNKPLCEHCFLQKDCLFQKTL